ncbi:YqaJ viral recombinase family protein [Vreelandella massiliensis]|uniref:YqaJ viral recombinase family nuclease n=1 Tax=Vreelandella massiliensis TaxID=1816686 RepID=UPI00096A8FF5|nr:YqaJ viral recombinase family protein [Halomonas massiliensis]
MALHYDTINVTQGEQDWLDWRQEGITATDAVVLAGISPYKSKWQLWAEKTGYASAPDLSQNPNVQRGNAIEAKIRAEWEQQTGDMMLPVCVQSKKSPLLRASLDGINDDNHPVEIKAPGQKVWKEIEDQGEQSTAFRMYWVQMQFQMLCLLAPKGTLVFGKEESDGSITLRSFEIQRDAAFAKQLLRDVAAFWKQVQTRSAPEKDPVLDHYIPEGEDAEAWRQAAAYYRTYQKEIDDMKARIKQLQEQQKPLVDTMLGLLGDEYKRGEFAGVMVTQYEQEGSVNYRKIVDDQLDLDDETLNAYRKPSSMRHRVTVTEEAPRNINDKEVVEQSNKPTKVIPDAFF